jgi:inorganic pyrophosphatase
MNYICNFFIINLLAEKLTDITDLSSQEIDQLKVLYNKIAEQKNKVIIIQDFASKKFALDLIEKSKI